MSDYCGPGIAAIDLVQHRCVGTSPIPSCLATELVKNMVQVPDEEMAAVVELHGRILDPISNYPVYQRVGVSSVNSRLVVDKFPDNTI